MALFQFPGDIFHGDAHLDHQHHDVIRQIGNFIDRLGLVFLPAADDDLGAFLADLFENFVQPLFKEVGGVGPLRPPGVALLEQLIEA